jgi:hypothetical protein
MPPERLQTLPGYSGRRATGRGADIVLIDDPLKPEEALSEAQRKAANEWYDHTLLQCPGPIARSSMIASAVRKSLKGMIETLRVIGEAMAEAGVVGLGRLTVSRRERMVITSKAEQEGSRRELRHHKRAGHIEERDGKLYAT